MKRLLILIGPDKEFASAMERFIREGEYCDRLNIRSFTHCEHAGTFMNDNRGESPVILHEETIADEEVIRWFGEGHNGLVYRLSETPEYTDLTAGNRIYRYQPFRTMLRDLLLRAAEQSGGPGPGKTGFRSGCTSVLAVYSAFGGSGKSVLALNMATQLAAQGRKVLYVTLEAVSSSALLMKDGPPDSFSRLLYAWRKSRDRTADYADLLQCRHPAYGFDYLAPLPNIREADELQEEDVSGLVGRIADSGICDVLLLDLDSVVQPRTLGALRASDIVLWLVTQDAHALYKTRKVLEAMKPILSMSSMESCTSKSLFVVNKYTGGDLGLVKEYDVAVFETLPYIPAWKTVSDPADWLGDPVFAAQVGHMLRRFSEGAEAL
ncbi:AAA family ATPase [Paenibacillus chitinolyticus]|uniref:AAA family ATPase n=1 Tax=Paenibacillus chitinolyticus TaxID=79263 RepID=UPI003649103A